MLFDGFADRMNHRGHNVHAPSWLTLWRTAIVYLWTPLVTIVLGFIVILISFFSKTGNLPHLIARIWARSILFVSGVNVSVNGRAHINTHASYIFMANHQSNFDIPVLLGYLPVQFRWVAKAELFKIPLFGRSMKGCGYISIDRFNRESAIESLNRAAKEIRNGASVVIFPEGTRSVDGRIKAFKKGGFVLSVDAGVPILPIVIHGTRLIMPKKSLSIKPGQVRMDILPAVSTQAYSRESKEDLMDVIREMMCEAYSGS